MGYIYEILKIWETNFKIQRIRVHELINMGNGGKNE